jgi:beta-hydroxylase
MTSLTRQLGQFYSDFKIKKRAFLLAQGGKLLEQLEKLIIRYSLIGNQARFDSQQFSWVADLESNWQAILQELETVLQYRDQLPNFQDLSADQYSITQDDRWKTYLFYGFGIKAERNCQRCPKTAQLLEQIPGMKTAFFSILLPHKHIPRHRGVYKGVVRCHLGLKVPQPQQQCRIQVGQQLCYWEEGKCLIFDDTFDHEVWNETDDIRVVLLFDFVRPLRFPLSWLNQLIIAAIARSPFIQDHKDNAMQWETVLDNVFSQQN